MKTPNCLDIKHVPLSPYQRKILYNQFALNPKPDPKTRKDLALQLNISEKKVQNWFQNHRSKVLRDERQDQHIILPEILSNTVKNPTPKTNISAPLLVKDIRALDGHTQKDLVDTTYSSINWDTPRTPDYYHIRQSQPHGWYGDPGSDANLGSRNIPGISATTGSCWLQLRTGFPATAFKDISSRPKHGKTLFPVNGICIGNWIYYTICSIRNPIDLVFVADHHLRLLYWQIWKEGCIFAVHIRLEDVQHIRLQRNIDHGCNYTSGDLVVKLHRLDRLEFYKKEMAGNNPDWVQCNDFTENMQATTQGIQVFKGNHDGLKSALVNLVKVFPEILSKVTFGDPLAALASPALTDPSLSTPTLVQPYTQPPTNCDHFKQPTDYFSYKPLPVYIPISMITGQSKATTDRKATF
ncbi:hypothetical protein CLU79DRAFT_832417 [Phycomyces nitens]|nr:hypothetical protein CLU79DRAFT_832417 [Phycomyces nitens]